MWSCKNCGMQNNDKFCMKCGAERPENIAPDTAAKMGRARAPNKRSLRLLLGGCAVLVCVGLASFLLLHKPPLGSANSMDASAAPASAAPAAPASAAPAAPASAAEEAELTALESGEYPIGTYLTLTAGKDEEIYYALGGKEIDNLALQDFALYKDGEILLPPYESSLQAYSKNALGVESDLVFEEYVVYDDDAGQQAYAENEELVSALAPFLGTENPEKTFPFESPEKMSLEQRKYLALNNAKGEFIQMDGFSKGIGSYHLEDLNSWLSLYFGGRAKPLVSADLVSDSLNNDCSGSLPYSYVKPADTFVASTPGGELPATVLSYVEAPSGAVELTVLLSYSGYYGVGIAGVTIGGMQSTLGFTGDISLYHVDPAFKKTFFYSDGTAGETYDENKIRRMNCGAYSEFYRCTFIPRSSGGYMVESIRALTPDFAAAYAPVVRASVPSGSTIAPKGYLRLNTDVDWLGDLYYSYDGVDYKKYPGVLIDIPEEDFSLYAYVGEEGRDGEPPTGRVYQFDYSTCEIDPRVLEQLQVYICSISTMLSADGHTPKSVTLDDISDIDFAYSIYMAYMASSDLSIYMASQDLPTYEEDYYIYFLSEDVDALAERITCGKRKVNPQGFPYYFAEKSAYRYPGICMWIPSPVYTDYCKTPTGFTVKARGEYNPEMFGEEGIGTFGSKFRCNMERECDELRPGLYGSEEAVRCVAIKNYDALGTLQSYDDAEKSQFIGWQEFTFTEDPATGGLYLESYKPVT